MASSLADLQSRRRTQLAAFLLEYKRLGSLIDDPLLRSATTNLAAAKEQLVAAGETANSTIVARPASGNGVRCRRGGCHDAEDHIPRCGTWSLS